MLKRVLTHDKYGLVLVLRQKRSEKSANPGMMRSQIGLLQTWKVAKLWVNDPWDLVNGPVQAFTKRKGVKIIL